LNTTTFHLQTVEGQINPVRDVRDNLHGFTQNNNWNNQNAQMQNLLEPMIAPTVDQKPSVRILEQIIEICNTYNATHAKQHWKIVVM